MHLPSVILVATDAAGAAVADVAAVPTADSKMAVRCLEKVSRPPVGGGRGGRRASGDGRGISGDIMEEAPAATDVDGERLCWVVTIWKEQSTKKGHQ